MQEIVSGFNEDVKVINDMKSCHEVKVKYFGKKGIIAGLMSEMRNAEDKKAYGQLVNELKVELESLFAPIEVAMQEKEIDEKMLKEAIDISLPSRKMEHGVQNVLIQTACEIESIFTNMGFEIAIGQEVESDFHNFEALNLDINHPARDMQDTFYIDVQTLLRTHTSNIQSRTLSTNPNKELKIICPGKVYRRDDDDATHSHQFMQLEGLMVVEKEGQATASLQDLKTILTIFANQIFNQEDLEIRMRPSFFPFTEPSVEVDVTCSSCLGSGCKFCKQTGFIEVLGAGIVHKRVLEIAGYDSDKYTGYAFGIGVERIALLKHNIEDIRNFYQNDARFIKQFNK